MFLRKNVFHLILFCTLIFLLGYLAFFLFTSKAWAVCTEPGGTCTADGECCDDCGRNYCVGNTLKNDCQPGVCSSGICTLGIGRPRTHTEQCDCWCTQPIGNVDGYCDGDARRGQDCVTPYGCCENVDGTGREGTCYKRYDCYGSCNFYRFNPNGCGNGQCACGEDADNCAADCAAPTPTPVPTPTPTPPPGTCENNCGGLGVCGFRKPDGSCTTDNSCCHRICNASKICVTVNGSGSNACDNNAQCVGPTPTPTPTPPPGCSPAAVIMSPSPNPVPLGQTITFSLSGTQGFLCVCDIFSGGVSCPGFPNPPVWPTSQICTATTAGGFNWTHRWRNDFSCGNSCTNPTSCTKTLLYTINPVYTPWIQVTGDVHSNTRIRAPGGP